MVASKKSATNNRVPIHHQFVEIHADHRINIAIKRNN